MWSVRKKYHQTEFEPDSSSIGYEIEVYQDSINKATREFLVNFDYLTQLLENYGFDLVSPEEAATTLVFPMPDGTATFDGMYHQMELDCKKKREETGAGGGGVVDDDGWSRQCRQEYGSALYMTPAEKQVSFYNRYFIFRKNRNINAKQLKSSFLSYAGLQEEQDRAAAGASGEDDRSSEQIALEKIAKASRPIDVASKPAIAAHILEERRTEKQLAAIAGTVESAGSAAASKPTTVKIKPKPKKVTAKASAAAAAAAAEDAESEAQSAPIEQIEKKIQKRTKKVKASAAGTSDTEETSGAAAAKPKDNGESAAPKQKRQTKKKSDL
jgi:hypothetical protein